LLQNKQQLLKQRELLQNKRLLLRLHELLQNKKQRGSRN
jgi:hypothetical protein